MITPGYALEMAHDNARQNGVVYDLCDRLSDRERPALTTNRPADRVERRVLEEGLQLALETVSQLAAPAS